MLRVAAYKGYKLIKVLAGCGSPVGIIGGKDTGYPYKEHPLAY